MTKGQERVSEGTERATFPVDRDLRQEKRKTFEESNSF
jgi:hypothetical protein